MLLAQTTSLRLWMGHTWTPLGRACGWQHRDSKGLWRLVFCDSEFQKLWQVPQNATAWLELHDRPAAQRYRLSYKLDKYGDLQLRGDGEFPIYYFAPWELRRLLEKHDGQCYVECKYRV